MVIFQQENSKQSFPAVFLYVLAVIFLTISKEI
ncbi:hypothetical protein RTO_23950 [[Ruminococcus] torques L2-14]|uniref:Uncharacterized protein n=1 Tax=[Ruminococcus] torques L2-14 TaxID=657313 RepID=D4M6M0_9FIRM|nr:hypothetical protein RTO_23950 [[Ruminococcus] torques L2-14]